MIETANHRRSTLCWTCWNFCGDEGISPDIIAEVEKFRDAYPTADPALLRRVPDPR